MNQNKVITGILSLLVIAIPFLSAYYLVTCTLDSKFSNYTPRWSDEIFYWHQVATFRTVGFNGGYYTVNEMEAPCHYLHFYCHGPVYPILFGYIGRFVGWEIYYAPIMNIFLLTSAIAWFIIKRKPNYLQLLFIGMLLLLFWPIHLYMITAMRLVIDVSLAIVLASFFCTVINTPDALSRYYRIGFPLILLILALYLPTWAFLFLPYWLLIRKQMGLTGFQAIALAVISIAISFILYSRITAPYPYGFVYCLSTALSHSPIDGIKLFFQHIVDNLRLFFDLQAPQLWLLVRAQLLLAILGSLFAIVKKKKEETAFREGVFVFMSCGLLGLGGICLYDIFGWRDFRMFAPFVFMAGLIFIEHKRFFLVALMLFGCLLLLPAFRNNYSDFSVRAFPSNRDAIKTFQDEITPILQYHFSQNAWDNTLLVHQSVLDNSVLLGVPPGIGISWYSNPKDMREIKSRYLLINKANIAVLKDNKHLKYIQTTSIGDLYLNQPTE